MAVHTPLNHIWKCAAIFVAVAIAAASAVTRANVTLFTFTTPAGVTGLTSATVDAQSSVTMRCRVEYNATSRSPTVNLRKSYGNLTWSLATNDVISDIFANSNRFTANIIDNQPNGIDIYEWTITELQLGDIGNYSCFTQTSSNSSSRTVSLNVSAEPTQLNLYIDNEVQNQSLYTAVNKKVLNIGQTYRIMCVAWGGFPSPNVTLTSGSTVLPTESVRMIYDRVNYVDPVSPVISNTSITASWTMTNLNVGTVVSCKAGVKNPNARSNSFIALADNALPNFDCPDQFDYDGKQTVLTLTCKVVGTGLSSYYISWRNKTANLTVVGTTGVDISATGDSRYVLRVNAPQNNDVWWTMTLTINNANMIPDLGNITFHYVAAGSRGQAVHDVTVKSSMKGPTSGGSLTILAVNCMALVSSIVVAMLFSWQ